MHWAPAVFKLAVLRVIRPGDDDESGNLIQVLFLAQSTKSYFSIFPPDGQANGRYPKLNVTRNKPSLIIDHFGQLHVLGLRSSTFHHEVAKKQYKRWTGLVETTLGF